MSPERTTRPSTRTERLLATQIAQHLRLSALFHKSGAVFAGEEKIPRSAGLDKPAVPPRRPASLNGGGEYATVFQPKRTKRLSGNNCYENGRAPIRRGAACCARIGAKVVRIAPLIIGRKLSAPWRKFGVGFAGEAKTLLGKPAVQPCPCPRLKGGAAEEPAGVSPLERIRHRTCAIGHLGARGSSQSAGGGKHAVRQFSRISEWIDPHIDPRPPRTHC
jgi:hypothetical protein